jgi:hypothetical protein
MTTMVMSMSAPLRIAEAIARVVDTRFDARDECQKPPLSRRTLLDYAGQKIGPCLLVARDEDELAAALDLVVDSREFRAIQTAMEGELHNQDCVQHGGGEHIGSSAYVRFSAWAKSRWLFGKSATAMIGDAAELGARIEDAIESLDAGDHLGTDLGTDRTGLDFLSTCSVPEARALLNGLKGIAAYYALVHSVSERNRVPRWLAAALAQRWRDGRLEYLRLLASYPGAKVPENVVPREDRLDLAAEDAKVARVRDAMATLAKRRKAEGKDVLLAGSQQ